MVVLFYDCRCTVRLSTSNFFSAVLSVASVLFLVLYFLYLLLLSNIFIFVCADVSLEVFHGGGI